jgi:hypothetical protein
MAHPGRSERTKYVAPVQVNKVACLYLHKAGYTWEQVSRAMDRSVSQVRKWAAEVEGVWAETCNALPELEAAVARTQSLIPMALNVYEHFMRNWKEYPVQARQAAFDLMTTHRVLKTQVDVTVNDDLNKEDSELYAEAAAIIARGKGKTGADTVRTPKARK